MTPPTVVAARVLRSEIMGMTSTSPVDFARPGSTFGCEADAVQGNLICGALPFTVFGGGDAVIFHTGGGGGGDASDSGGGGTGGTHKRAGDMPRR